jgi:hypothetical protein
LEVDNGFFANGAAAIDEVFGDEANFSYVKMFRNEGSVGLVESNGF